MTTEQSDRGPSSTQRREFPRHTVELDVGLGSEHIFYCGLAENLSVAGIFVATHAVKPVGELILLSIFLPDRSLPIRAHGEVRWTRVLDEANNLPPGMGVRFTTLIPADEQAIEVFLRAFSAAPPDKP